MLSRYPLVLLLFNTLSHGLDEKLACAAEATNYIGTGRQSCIYPYNLELIEINALSLERGSRSLKTMEGQVIYSLAFSSV